MCMVTVKDLGNKAPVELLTHPYRQLRYSASNWANKAMFSCYCIVISAKFMGPYLKNATVKNLKMSMVTVKGPGNKALVEFLTHP